MIEKHVSATVKHVLIHANVIQYKTA